MDDVIILETNVNYIQVLIDKLSQELALKNLQTLYYFMGIEVKSFQG